MPKTIIVTAGPTYEPLDPVRFIGNRSTGKMGFAIAARAAEVGYRVILIAGPVHLPTPPGVERIDVETASEMCDAIFTRTPFATADAIIMTAAVADFRVADVAAEKIKKVEGQGGLILHLIKNVDILAELGAAKREARIRDEPFPYLVGFAAETGGLNEKAQVKLAKKGCDLLVGNDVSKATSTFGSDTNEVTLFRPGEPMEVLPLLPKAEVATAIIARIQDVIGPPA